MITDLKGQVTNSSILDLFVTSASLDPQRHDTMMARVALTKEVEEFKKKVESLREAAKADRQKFESNRDNPEAQKEFAKSIQKFAEAADKEVDECARLFPRRSKTSKMS